MEAEALALEAAIRNFSWTAGGLLCAIVAIFSTWRRHSWKAAHSGRGADGWLAPIIAGGLGVIVTLCYSLGQGPEDIAHVITYYSQDDQPEVKQATVVSDFFPDEETVEPITEEAEELYTEAVEEIENY